MTAGKFILTILVFALFLNSCTRNETQDEQDKQESVRIDTTFRKYFEACGTEGDIAVYDYTNRTWVLSDSTDASAETLPASTFKIINLLVALETGVIRDENEIVKWSGKTDTTKYGYRPDIYHDITVKEAFKASAGWVFVELSKLIGKENYEKYLSQSGYGNADLSQADPDFWNFGAFGISPINQVVFLKRLYENNLPFSERNMEIAKRVMISEQGEDSVLRAKTGWTRENGINTGWWVGYLENERGTFFFATRLLQDRQFKRDDFGACRKSITQKVFTDLGITDRL